MRIARFRLPDADSGVRFGVVEGAGTDSLEVAPIDGHPFGQVTFTGERFPLSAVTLLPPMLPSKVVCVGKNYLDHVNELSSLTGGEVPEAPLLFLKPSTSVIGPHHPIKHPTTLSERVDFEGELAVVIGTIATDLTVDNAMDAVYGYTVANDVTARDLQTKDKQWSRAKGFDTFCPLGPWIETNLDPSDLAITTTVDDEIKQAARTSQLIFDIPTILAHITAAMTLLPGDVVLTGTPAGVGPMTPGQSVTVTIEGIGSLTNTVVAR